MILMSVIKDKDNSNIQEISNFMFDSVNDFDVFIRNNYEHEMQTFNKYLSGVYKLDISIGFIDCTVNKFYIEKINYLQPLFATTDKENELSEYWEIDELCEYAYYHSPHKTYIPTKLKEIFDRVKRRTMELNLEY